MPPSATAAAADKKPTDLTKEEKDQIAELIIDLQTAKVTVANVKEQMQKTLDEANQALGTAQNAFNSKFQELQKKHGAEGYTIDLRRNWLKLPEPPTAVPKKP